MCIRDRQEERGFEVPVAEMDPTAVQLLTVHAAKGLEWDVVVVPALVVCGVVVGAVAAGGGIGNIASFLTDQSTRGLQVESVTATPWVVASLWRDDVDIRLNDALVTWEIVGPGTTTAAAVLDTALALAVGLVAGLLWWARTRGRSVAALIPGAFLTLIVLVVLNKMGSPQLQAWLAAPVAVKLGRPSITATGAANQACSWGEPTLFTTTSTMRVRKAPGISAATERPLVRAHHSSPATRPTARASAVSRTAAAVVVPGPTISQVTRASFSRMSTSSRQSEATTHGVAVTDSTCRPRVDWSVRNEAMLPIPPPAATAPTTTPHTTSAGTTSSRPGRRTAATRGSRRTPGATLIQAPAVISAAARRGRPTPASRARIISGTTMASSRPSATGPSATCLLYT